MPFQPGNTEASKRGQNRRFKAALIRYVDADPRKLDELAAKLWSTAMEGDTSAMKEIADRLDGKVAQPIAGDSELDPINLVAEIKRTIVDPGHTDSQSVPPAPETGEV